MNASQSPSINVIPQEAEFEIIVTCCSTGVKVNVPIIQDRFLEIPFGLGIPDSDSAIVEDSQGYRYQRTLTFNLVHKMVFVQI